MYFLNGFFLKLVKVVVIFIIFIVYRGMSKYNVYVLIYRWIDMYDMVFNFDS